MLLKTFILICLLFSLSTTLYASDVVALDGESGMVETKSSVSTSIENLDDGKLILNDQPKLGESETPAEISTTAPVVVSTESAPVEVKNDDYQISESQTTNSQVKEKGTEKKSEVFPSKTSPVLIDSMADHPFFIHGYPRSFIHVYSGRLNTNLKKVSPTLSKGIDIFGFGVARVITDQWQGIMALEIGQKKNEKNTSKNIVIYQLKVGAEFSKGLFDSQKMKLLIHSALTVGDFNLKSTSSESINVITQNKYGEGTLIGLHPGLGLRFPVGNFFHLDALAMHPVYLGKNPKNLGGFQYLARFALPW